jgi:hypothetical protein
MEGNKSIPQNSCRSHRKETAIAHPRNDRRFGLDPGLEMRFHAKADSMSFARRVFIIAVQETCAA